MPDPMNPETLDETELMDGTVHSVAVECIGRPTVILWLTDTTGDVHQLHGSLESDAVSRLGMLQLLKDAAVANRDITVRYTVDGAGMMWFHLARMY